MSNNCINFINIIKNCFLSCRKNYFNKKDDSINTNNIESNEKIDIVIDKMEDNVIRKRNENTEIEEDNFEIIDESELEE
jgi:hypothetical protein